MKRLGKIMSKAAATAKTARHEGILPAFRRFRDEEEGSLLIFGLFCLIIMMMMSGMALDLMRFEERRTTLQNTTDRAVLAAADLTQTLDPKAVVKDYFLKAGLNPPPDNQISVQQGSYNEWRTVQANVVEQFPTWFMTAYGIPNLAAPANGTAEERIGQVEISLVLDVSGSMDENNKIGNLRVAAKEFVDTMFDAVEPNKLSMNIITYSTQVSAGPDLMSYFNATAEQTTSYCLEFNPADFNRLSFDFGFQPTDRVYQRNGHFDPFYSTSPLTLPNCDPRRSRDIIPFSGDRAALKTYIDGLTAGGNTSIDIGMKWGAGLLDPSVHPIVTDLIARGKINPNFGDRPYAYTDREALKVIVLMTDGSNTTEYKLQPDVRSGNSYLMTNSSYAANSTSTAQYSLWDPGKNQYWIFAKSIWRDQPWGDGNTTTCDRYGRNCVTTDDPGNAVQMTWPEVWAKMSTSYFANNIIRRATGNTLPYYSNWLPGALNGTATTYVTTGDKNPSALSLCALAKAQKVQIFTIGFEAPTAGKNLLKSCASSPANFYDVAGTNISTAFSSIASSINQLRLTQ